MYNIRIRDHIMIAHSLPHPAFGPAQNMHGATYVVDVSFFSQTLNEQNIVVDIAVAHEVLKKVLEPLGYKNLDELPQFKGHLTTTEFLAKYIHDEIKAAMQEEFQGRVRVELGESHVAWAAYES